MDIGETLLKIYRTLAKAFPLSHSLRALSIGSSNEPQFRILQSAFSGGLYLVDIEKQALEVIQERIVRQNTHNVVTVHHDFHQLFLEEQKSRLFLKKELKGKKIDLNNKDIRAQKNITLGKTSPKPFEKENNHHSNFVF